MSSIFKIEAHAWSLKLTSEMEGLIKKISFESEEPEQMGYFVRAEKDQCNILRTRGKS